MVVAAIGLSICVMNDLATIKIFSFTWTLDLLYKHHSRYCYEHIHLVAQVWCLVKCSCINVPSYIAYYNIMKIANGRM